jgi:hypothetical protein
VNGLLAGFATADALVAALARLQEAGYTRLDAYTPFPLAEVTARLGGSTAAIGWWAAGSAVAAGVLTYAFVYWSAAIDYPLDVGGRPLNSVPAFLPSVLVVAALASGLATLVAMLRMADLPRWHHAAFDLAGFDRATYDRFLLWIDRSDPLYSAATRALVDSTRPLHVEEVGA